MNTRILSLGLSYLFCCLVESNNANAWDYGENGPAKWCDSSAKTCCGKKQSPLNLCLQGQNFISKTESLIRFTDFNVPLKNMRILNDGHSVQLFNTDPVVVPRISGSGLNEGYLFHSLVLHWGNDADTGSEHTLFGFSFSMELQLIHFKESFADFNTALTSEDDDALSILAVFLMTTDFDNKNLNPIIEILGEIETEGNETELITPIQLINLLPQNTNTFYRYNGSLTSPSCEENVIWTVFTTPISVSDDQMQSFRALKTKQGSFLTDNFRTPQPPNNRPVYRVLTI